LLLYWVPIMAKDKTPKMWVQMTTILIDGVPIEE